MHTDSCACVHCERVKLRTVDVDAWRTLHQYHGDFAGVFSEEAFPHEREWHWVICECGSRVLAGEHPLQQKAKRVKRKKSIDNHESL